MKFYGSGVVWDKTADRRLCRFKDGEFETDDQRVIKLLKAAGYRSDDSGREAVERDAEGQAPETEPKTEPEAEEAARYKDLEELTINVLRQMAKELGLIGYYKLSKAELIEALKEGD